SRLPAPPQSTTGWSMAPIVSVLRSLAAVKPNVTIVIAVKNAAGTLQRCLDSVFAQRGALAEVVVVDALSTDGTLELLRANAPRLGAWISEPDSGIYAAWNKGIARARADWIAFLGADDALAGPDALAGLLAAAARGPERIVYGRIELVAPSGRVVETVGRPWPAAREAFLDGFMLPHPGALHHRSLFERHGPFDESYRIAGDYEMLLRELRSQDAKFADCLVARVALGGASSRPGTIHRTLKEVARARRRHGLPPSRRLATALAASWVGARDHAGLGATAFHALADLYRVVRGKPRLWTK
ncbi:MAG TPA: glycosyltransferase family 2 protein, partial [Burkholderiales bacterium]|nr:glycosyltransferase family 2 protein [Burkholderiales bacterium]